MSRRADIAPIAEQHIPEYRAVVDFVARERQQLAYLQGFPLEDSRDFVLNNLRRGYPHFVALYDGEVVGWCDITPDRHETGVHAGMLGVGLMPAYRGHGNGKALMRTAIEAAWDGLFTRIEVNLNEANKRAIKLCRSLGFEIEGRKRNAELVNGAYSNVIILGLLKEDWLARDG